MVFLAQQEKPFTHSPGFLQGPGIRPSLILLSCCRPRVCLILTCSTVARLMEARRRDPHQVEAQVPPHNLPGSA
jgi:hypothetical protein